ncbi:unnamed protein product, partial [Closterium sp. NIES-54]
MLGAAMKGSPGVAHGAEPLSHLAHCHPRAHPPADQGSERGHVQAGSKGSGVGESELAAGEEGGYGRNKESSRRNPGGRAQAGRKE